MKYKVAELEGARLDAAVAKALGYQSTWDVPDSICGPDTTGGAKWWSPSSDWEQAGPIIERERLALTTDAPDHCTAEEPWYCEHPTANVWATGATPLMAAMRAFAVSKLDEEVELP